MLLFPGVREMSLMANRKTVLIVSGIVVVASLFIAEAADRNFTNHEAGQVRSATVELPHPDGAGSQAIVTNADGSPYEPSLEAPEGAAQGDEADGDLAADWSEDSVNSNVSSQTSSMGTEVVAGARRID